MPGKLLFRPGERFLGMADVNFNFIIMKRKLFLAASLVACTLFSASAQTTSDEPKGKAIVQVFGNFHSGFGAERNDRGFELERSYLGYEYSIGKSLSIKGVMDIGKSNNVTDYQRIAYIKNALITYRTGNLTLNGGLISTTQFNMQEKFWGYRYVMKSFQDEYKFGSSADLGISAAYKFADWISADAIVVNGEGYKKIQNQDCLLYGLGTTITPLKGLSIRLYGGVNEGVDDKKDVYNFASFVGYRNSCFSIAAEYNVMQNNGNKENADLRGFSIYSSVKLNKTVDVYARYDELSSKDDWNIANDEKAILVGAQMKLGKYVKVAPNFRVALPAADGADNRYMGYISCYFGF